jgi:hypothetical protein
MLSVTAKFNTQDRLKPFFLAHSFSFASVLGSKVTPACFLPRPEGIRRANGP